MGNSARGRRILILDPSPPEVGGGNRVTALRWALLLRQLGARVHVRSSLDSYDYDVLIALHAIKTAPSVRKWRKHRGHAPLIVALTGTDFQAGNARDVAMRSLEEADRIVVLFEQAIHTAFDGLGTKAVVIPQSFAKCESPEPNTSNGIVISMLANLRPVKDPLVAVRAWSRVPQLNNLRLVLVGGVLDEALAEEVRHAQAQDPRIRWVGHQRRRTALEQLAASHALLCTSRHEGGAGSVAEALALGRAVLSTDLPACHALLDGNHPGFFPIGDDAALATLLERFATDSDFRSELKQASLSHAHLVERDLERERWRKLLGELYLRC